WPGHRVEKSIKEFAVQLVQGTLKNLGQIDELISKYAQNWQLKRMAVIDRNILRLGCFELLFLEEVPPKVAINEAVELAKRYGDSDSSKFVNGILDKINKEECSQWASRPADQPTSRPK
ncbi:MAG: transcription antitermination factor NusB, partial [Candidatus Omnitrophica bacterium]|nr:transcription antitermination factor NusB [Candidatus Omnitrophota bacterium]